MPTYLRPCLHTPTYPVWRTGDRQTSGRTNRYSRAVYCHCWRKTVSASDRRGFAPPLPSPPAFHHYSPTLYLPTLSLLPSASNNISSTLRYAIYLLSILLVVRVPTRRQAVLPGKTARRLHALYMAQRKHDVTAAFLLLCAATLTSFLPAATAPTTFHLRTDSVG